MLPCILTVQHSIISNVTKRRKNPAAVALGKKSAAARMKKLSAEKRTEIARIAARARWSKRPSESHTS